ncbi:MBL fold metallo-hydrolase [Butyricimonas hominis]|uniref:MBL fold metallo-hydrolase n=1 Tax=Butyricimonas hominis TaxID=2763032 RepID=UPI0035163FC6
MRSLKKHRRHMVIWSVLGVVAVIAVIAVVFVNQRSFGRLPRGERMERVKRSPHYRDGRFQNLHETVMIASDKGRVGTMIDFLFRKTERLRPETAVPVIKTDLRSIPLDEEVVVWFGHSSYLIQTGGKRILVDPVFCMASPVSFVNKPFKGTDVYKPEDMPDIDYLVISHDHWDHLDYGTVTALKNRVGKVICGLGVGEHFEYWGFDKERIVELDWFEDSVLDDGFAVHCLPVRHFSGRGLSANQTLWASFLVESPSRKIYIGGDGGYDTHFAEIGKRFPGIDLAVIENGQYNEDWKYIHVMPDYLEQIAKDLGAKSVLTVHHSKYALARHPWDEPLKNALKMREDVPFEVLIPTIGEIVRNEKVEQ